jgi:hypothetical protein
MRPLPERFLEALAGSETVRVTSREGDAEGTVPVWYVVGSPGVLYLFGESFARKARRWRTDPWVRLRVPGTGATAEGRIQFVEPGPELDALAPRVVERWAGWGATTVEGLRRTLRDRTHVLVRVEGSP